MRPPQELCASVGGLMYKQLRGGSGQILNPAGANPFLNCQ